MSFQDFLARLRLLPLVPGWPIPAPADSPEDRFIRGQWAGSDRDAGQIPEEERGAPVRAKWPTTLH